MFENTDDEVAIDCSKRILTLLEKHYLSQTRNKELLQSILRDSTISTLSSHIQKEIVKCTIDNPVALKYPPPPSYKKFFLRLLLDEVELQNCETSETLLLAYIDMLKNPEKEEPYHSCYIINDKIFTLQENMSFVISGTTGLKTWEASKYLSEWCIEISSELKDKRILELGSGTGLLGCVVLNFCQPSYYIFTDKSEEVLRLLSTNIKINCASREKEVTPCKIVDNYSVSYLNWNEISVEEAKNHSPDIILGADIVFDPTCIQGLVKAINLFFNSGTERALIASTIRNEDTDLKFQSELNSAKLKYNVQESRSTGNLISNSTSYFKLYEILKL